MIDAAALVGLLLAYAAVFIGIWSLLYGHGERQ